MSGRDDSMVACRFCGLVGVEPLAAPENPFCAECLHDRVARATRDKGPVRVRSVGDGYVVITRDDQPAAPTSAEGEVSDG